jgi:tRNA A37 threonylcarbamoyladenosine synthetase subunit TsaC/SUA5/YrdC
MRKQFGDELDFIVSGFATGGASSSEIRSLSSGAILRSGS